MNTTHNVSDTTESFHNYTIEWTARAITWSIDGTQVRKLEPDLSDSGDTYPQTPMQVRFGSWIMGRKDSPEEALEWAGGVVDMGEAPFRSWLKGIRIVDYGGGSEVSEKRVKEYGQKGQSGTYESVEVLEMDGDEEEEDDLVDELVEEKTTGGVGSTASKTTDPDALGGAKTTNSDNKQENTTEDDTNNGLSPGAMAGIVIGSVAAAALLAAAGFLLHRHRQQMANANRNTSADDELHGKLAEAYDSSTYPAHLPGEMSGVGVVQELDTKREPVELDSSPVKG